MKYLIIALSMCLSSVMSAQSVEGTVFDEKGSPVKFANVVALALPDTTFLSGATTDSLGHFNVETQGKDVLLRLSCIGYETLTANATQGIMRFTLHKNSIMLGDVVVKGSVPQYRMTGEGLQTNVAGTVLEKLGTADDVLKHIPGMIEGNDGWEVFGKGSPIIYLNGRPLRDIGELDNLKSSDIKSVEVIRHPGAKYAASVGAVVRIKTVRRKGEGFSVDVRSTYRYNNFNNFVEQLNTNYRHDGLNLFAVYKYSNIKFIKDAQHDLTTKADTLWEQKISDYSESKQEYHFLQTGASYDFNDNHSIGAYYSVTFTGDEHSEGHSDSKVTANDLYYDHIATASTEKNESSPIHRLNLYYNGTLGKTSIDFNTDLYFNHTCLLSTNSETSDKYDSRSILAENSSRNRMIAGKLVVSSPLFGGTLNYGAEYAHTTRTDNYTSDHTDLVTNSDARLKEITASPFAEYIYQTSIGGLAVGLRYEHVAYKYYKNGEYMDRQSRTFSNFFPSISFGTQIGKTAWQLVYSAKTRRPSYSQLSNNVSYVNRFSRQTGNPLLTHQTDHELSLTGVWKYIQMMVEYKDSRNAIIYWAEQLPEDESIMLVNYKNEKSIKSLTAYVSAAPTIGWWSPQINLGMVKQWFTLNTSTGSYKLNHPIFVADFNNTFSLPLGFTANIDFSFQGKGNMDNAQVLKNQYDLEVGLSKSFLHDSMALEIKGRDLLYQRWDTGALYNDKTFIQQLCRRGTRDVSFTLRYKFNTTRSKYKGTGAGNSIVNRM